MDAVHLSVVLCAIIVAFIIHLTHQYKCGIMMLWEFMCASCVTHPHTHHRDRVCVSFAFNIGTPFGVLLIQGDFFND